MWGVSEQSVVSHEIGGSAEILEAGMQPLRQLFTFSWRQKKEKRVPVQPLRASIETFMLTQPPWFTRKTENNGRLREHICKYHTLPAIVLERKNKNICSVLPRNEDEPMLCATHCCKRKLKNQEHLWEFITRKRLGTFCFSSQGSCFFYKRLHATAPKCNLGGACF